MSCFIVEAESIRQLTLFIDTLLNRENDAIQVYHIYGAGETVTKAFKDCWNGYKYDAHKIYRKLYIMNLRAYNGRYKGENVKTFEKYREADSRTDKITLYKSMQCYIYQCSEYPVDGSDLYNAIVELQHALASSIIDDLPEYKAAKWA